jgi:hypothetical protein
MATKTKRDRSVFQSAEEAAKSPLLEQKGSKGQDINFIFAVTNQGVTLYTVAGDPINATYNVAKSAGYTVIRPDRAPTKDSAAAILAQLSPEDRQAVLTQFGGKPKN